MNIKVIKLIALNTWKSAFRVPATRVLIVILGVTLLAAAYIGSCNYVKQYELRHKYQDIVRNKWLAQPDKHPHRMAHYGYLAFRPKHKLSFFDVGIESFAGVSVFLEAHKQNTVNFSEAGFSTGMLRFGEMSISMVLQLLIPLLIFFLGYSAIATEREMGTLRMLLIQGVSWKELILGKVSGIVLVTFMLFIPIMLLTVLMWAGFSHWQMSADDTYRILLLFFCYLLYFVICAAIAVMVSAMYKKSGAALISLMGIWFFFTILMPKVSQSAGAWYSPSPYKLIFDAGIHRDIARIGDNHNAEDPYFNKIKEDILNEYHVKTTSELPFSYAGFIMMKGEEITARVYSEHHAKLIDAYRRQNKITKFLGYINPYIAIKNLSMALTGTDFENYADFQRQTEAYRYMITQRMNDLHMKHIQNTKDVYADRKGKVTHDEWKNVPAFEFKFRSVGWVLYHESIALFSIIFWFLFVVLGIFWISKRVNAL